MAKLIGGKFLVGSIGDLRFYELNGETIVSLKGGPSAKQIKTRPSCARIRQNNLEFGAMGKLSGYIKRCMRKFSPLWYKPHYDQFNALLRQILKADTVNGIGERNLQFSNARELLRMYQLSKTRLLDYTSIQCVCKRISDISFQIHVPEIQEYNHLSYPEGYDDFEYSLHAMCLPDILFDPKTGSYPQNQFLKIKPLQEIFSTNEFHNTKIEAQTRIIEMPACPNYLITAYLKLSSKSDLRLPPIHNLMLLQLV